MVVYKDQHSPIRRCMLRIRVNTLSRTTPVQPRVARWILRHGILILAFVLLGSVRRFSDAAAEHNPAPRIRSPNGRMPGKSGRAVADGGRRQENGLTGAGGKTEIRSGRAGLAGSTAKRLEQTKNISQPGRRLSSWYPHIRFDGWAKQSRENDFRFGRLINAANALLNACDGILWARKTEKTPQESDFWAWPHVAKRVLFPDTAGGFLCALEPREKLRTIRDVGTNSLSAGAGAYDAREFTRAKSLADASGSIVFALESIAQANAPAPEPKSPK